MKLFIHAKDEKKEKYSIFEEVDDQRWQTFINLVNERPLRNSTLTSLTSFFERKRKRKIFRSLFNVE